MVFFIIFYLSVAAESNNTVSIIEGDEVSLSSQITTLASESAESINNQSNGNTPVSPVVDACSDPSFRDVVERVCDVPLVCAQAAGLQSAHGFTGANLRGLGFNSDYSTKQINNYAASRAAINKKTDIPRDCIGKTS